MSAIVGFSRAFTETLEQDWQQNERQQGGGDQTADHDDGERPLDLRSRAAREQQRHKAEGRDTGGHQDRKSVVSGKGVSVRVNLGGRRIITNKNNKSNIKQELIKK